MQPSVCPAMTVLRLSLHFTMMLLLFNIKMSFADKMFIITL